MAYGMHLPLALLHHPRIINITWQPMIFLCMQKITVILLS